MRTTQVTDGVFRLSANVDNILFEGMWPIPNGIAMNSYVVKGEKAAIIDGVCTWEGVPEELFEQLDQMKVKLEDIDYVIINHMEPDHSGWLEPFSELRGDDNFEILCTQRAVPLLESFYGITKNVRPVKSGDTLDLGDGRVLAFEEIPNVHWPETMATYDTKTKTLFPCDAFGSFGSVADDAPYDDQLDQSQIDFFEREASRYYADIVAAFSMPTKKAIDKVESLPVDIIAPGHGIVWRENPQKIVDDYKRYASYSKGPAKPEVTVIWGSMYGNTEQGVQPVVEGLESEGVKVHVHEVPETDAGFVLQSVWESSGVVLGMPTYEYKMFPAMAAVVDEIGKKKAFNRKAFSFGSYGWSGGAQKELQEIVERNKMKWDFLEPVEFKGRPTNEEKEVLKQRGKELAVKVKEWCEV
ncbi:MAG: MBL fold metallo-hydrolase [Spirochaetes bacterium]|jgi:flavorubredoxin|nr:MBL fold metallo-hydrolase [Spirochaetota bacterium]